MKRLNIVSLGVVLVMAIMTPSTFALDDIAKKLNDVLIQAPSQGNWQVSADDVASWINLKKTDFLVVDVRTVEEYKAGHIPGAIFIPYSEILKPESLQKLPKDKKIVLVCFTGHSQSLPLLGLRVLGYDAYSMAFGYAAWIKGYIGAQWMQNAIQNAATKNYPLSSEKETAPAAPGYGAPAAPGYGAPAGGYGK